ncbi:MAG: FmdB family zinc ribbon protein [Ideonella sp.]
MPIYAYRCETCGHAKDVLQKISDPVLSTCPACGAETFVKQVTAAGFQLKGSGWYVTDFRGGEAGKKKSESGDAAPAASDKSDKAETTPAAADAKPKDGADKPASSATDKPAAAAAPASSSSTAPAASTPAAAPPPAKS